MHRISTHKRGADLLLVPNGSTHKSRRLFHNYTFLIQRCKGALANHLAMDPLSITASSTAVLSAVTVSGRGINRLISLYKAPTELLALLNEVEALRGLLTIVQSSLRRIKGTDALLSYEVSLNVLLQAVQHAVLDLESKVEYQLKRNEEKDYRGRPKVSRMNWLRARPEIALLRQNIRDARDNLTAGLAAISLNLM